MYNLIKLNRKSENISSILNELDIPYIIKKIYANRGVSSINEINLNINNIFSFLLFKNINKTINLLIKCIYRKKNIFIVGDFDTDGVTSTALLVISLKKMGIKNINFIIPNRFKHGHGLNTNLVEEIRKNKGQVIITVDNGISSYEGIKLARKKNIIVIITDHHIPTYPLPNANSIINPNLVKCKFPSKVISGVGISYYLMKALKLKLNKIGWFKKLNIKIPNLNSLLDLVAIGTIADMSYMDLNNRILINYGINQIKYNKCRLGIIALIKISNLNIKDISISDISFLLIPKINAAGRLEDMSISMKLLLSDNMEEALFFAKKLDILNTMRKKISKNIEIESFNLCNKYIGKRKNIYSLIIFNTKWHNGIIGIIASKIKDKFKIPTIVFSEYINNKIIGSGRSIEGINLYEIIKEINILNSNLILKFGGHAMAIGLTIELNKLNLFKKFFNKIIKLKFKNNIKSKIIFSDGELLDNDINLNNVKLINKYGPWGHGFPNPIFDGEFNLISKKILNNNLKIIVKLINGCSLIEGIIFNYDKNFWIDLKSNKLILAYKLNINRYNNSNIQILIEHAWIINNKN